MGKKTKSSAKKTKASTPRQQKKQEDVAIKLSANIIDEAEKIRQSISAYKERRESLSLAQMGDNFFDLLQEVTNLYAKQERLICRYHNLVKDYLYPDGIFEECKISAQAQAEIKAEFQHVWKNYFVAIVEAIDEDLSYLLSLFKQNSKKLSEYVAEETGDNVFHLIARGNIPVAYCLKHLDIATFNGVFIEKFFFALNKKEESAYKIFLGRQQEVSYDADAVQKAKISLISAQDRLTIEDRIRSKSLKVYPEAIKIALFTKGTFVPSFNSLLLFINRTVSSSISYYVHDFTSFLVTHGLLMMRLAARDRDLFVKLDNPEEFNVAKESCEERIAFGISLPSAFEDVMLLSAIQVKALQEQAYQDCQKKCDDWSALRNGEEIPEEEENRIVDEARQLLYLQQEEEDRDFTRILGRGFYVHLVDTLQVNQIYTEKYTQFMPSNIGKDVTLYSHPLHMMLSTVCSFFVRQHKIEICTFHKYLHAALLAAVKDFSLEHDYGLTSVAVKEVKEIEGKQYIFPDILACSLARLSRLYYASYEHKRESLGPQYLTAHQAAIDAFNLFWDELSLTEKKDVLAHNDLFGRNLIVTAIETGSYDFLENLFKKIKEIKGPDVDLVSGLKISPVFAVIGEFDLARLKFLLDSNTGFSLDAKYFQNINGISKRLNPLEFCLYILDQEKYQKSRQKIDEMLFFLQDKIANYDRSFCQEELKKKGFRKKLLVRILGDEAKSSKLDNKSELQDGNATIDDLVRFVGEEDNSSVSTNNTAAKAKKNLRFIVRDKNKKLLSSADKDLQEEESSALSVYDKTEEELKNMWQILGFALDGDEEYAQYFLKLFAQYKAEIKQEYLYHYISEISTNLVHLSYETYQKILQEVLSLEGRGRDFCVENSNLIRNKALHNDQKFFKILFADPKLSPLFFLENKDLMADLIKEVSIDMLLFLREEVPALNDFIDREGNNLEQMINLFRDKEDLPRFSCFRQEKEHVVFKSEESESLKQILEDRQQEQKKVAESEILQSNQDDIKEFVEPVAIAPDLSRNNDTSHKIKSAILQRFRQGDKIVKTLQAILPESKVYYHGSSVYCAFLAERQGEEKFSALKRKEVKDLNIRVCLDVKDFTALSSGKFLQKLQKKDFSVSEVYGKGFGSFSFDIYAENQRYQITLLDKELLPRLPISFDVESLYLDVSTQDPHLGNSFLPESQIFLDNIASVGICHIFNYQEIEKLFFGTVRCSEGVLKGHRELIGSALTNAFQTPYYGDYLFGRFAAEIDNLSDYEQNFVNLSLAKAGRPILFATSNNQQPVLSFS